MISDQRGREAGGGDDAWRVLALTGVHNFRDHGGYAVAGGGRLRRGVLWRSGQHFGATDADLAAIDALGLVSVHDLRTAHERGREPCRRTDPFGARVFHPPVAGDRQAGKVLTGGEQTAPHINAAATTRQRTPEGTREALRRNYTTIAFRPELIAAMRAYLADVAERRGASLVNCMAGKDRTGTAVAMLHLALGVHRDDIMTDYLLTNTAGDVEARIAAGMATIRGLSPTMDDASLRVVMGVEAEYLDTMLQTLAEQHGSADRYLAEQLGVDDALRAKLREALVEG